MTVSDWLLVATTALAWYHVGFVWLVQVVAWPLFAYVGAAEFDRYHQAWWRGIRYVLFVPSGLAFVGASLLLVIPPPGVPYWLLATGLGTYVLTYLLTAVWWGPQQARLTDPRSLQFSRIVSTHWVRTALVSAFGLCFAVALAVRIG